eukprot:gene21447-biopygen427
MAGRRAGRTAQFSAEQECSARRWCPSVRKRRRCTEDAQTDAQANASKTCGQLPVAKQQACPHTCHHIHLCVNVDKWLVNKINTSKFLPLVDKMFDKCFSNVGKIFGKTGRELSPETRMRRVRRGRRHAARLTNTRGAKLLRRRPLSPPSSASACSLAERVSASGRGDRKGAGKTGEERQSAVASSSLDG